MLSVALSLILVVACYLLNVEGVYFYYVLLAFIFLLGWKAYHEFFVPIDQSHDEDAFSGQPKLTRRGALHIPPPFPNGWYYLISSWDLKPGDIKPVKFMDQSLVMFRGKEDEVVSVLDAYCPHLGVNLGVNGRIVAGDNIECPFHGWRFDGEGKCTHIPGQTNIPQQAHSRGWIVREVNAMVWIWYSVDYPDKPNWELPVLSEFDDYEWRWDGKADHFAKTHIQDVPENTADVAHLNNLHHLPWEMPAIIYNNVRLRWTGLWKPGKPEDGDEHCAHVPVTLELLAFGYPLPFMRVTIQILLIGPGIMLYDFNSPVGRMKMFETITPVSPLLQRVSVILFSKPNTVRWLAKLFFRSVAATLHQDIHLWNNKIYKLNPVLSKSDKYLRVFRKWYSQFYSPKSVKMHLSLETPEQSKTEGNVGQQMPSCTTQDYDW
eukprot:TRINITY_DN626_c0_g1_i1.p1 TRINITY_DN626_c0_g1~~TRINITY_DN626_c0_g1_i1.p1  ORF type:complete len:433 (+),score=10.69 TRINITY_DN626_c0_g1_i1:38-1336(+)